MFVEAATEEGTSQDKRKQMVEKARRERDDKYGFLRHFLIFAANIMNRYGTVFFADQDEERLLEGRSSQET
jgi:hypothetical protein